MRYIDADALIKTMFPYDVVDKKCYTINAKAVYDRINNTPAADVVPREEVEKIFRDIGILFNKYPTLGTIGGKELAELKKKYTQEGE